MSDSQLQRKPARTPIDQKRGISFWRLASFLIALLVGTVASVAGDFSYGIANEEVTITGYTGTDAAVVVPDTIESMPVTRIAAEAFFESNTLRSLTLGGNVTHIESAAFRECTNLSQVTLGDALVSVGESAFAYCGSLTSIAIPSKVTELGDSCFRGSGLARVDIPHRVEKIGHYVFSDCHDLVEVTIGDEVTSIGVYAFSHCRSLKTMSIPDAVTNIGDQAFSSCTSLESVTIGKGLSLIDYKAFSACPKLQRMAFEGDAPALNSYVFVDSPNVMVYSTTGSSGWGEVWGGLPVFQWYPYTYDVVGEEAVITGYLGAGRRITLPEAIEGLPVTAIADAAFANDETLISVTLSDRISSLGAGVFWGCERLVGVFTNAIHPTYSSRRGVLFDKELTTLLLYPPGKRGQYFVPSSVSTIADEAFAYTVELVSIRFDDGLKTVGGRAFLKSRALVSITLPATVTELGDQAFSSCPDLKHVYFEGNPPVHGDSLFAYGAEQAVVYYQLGATGWESSYGGLPTIEWDPQASFAAWLSNYSLLDWQTGLQDDPDHDGQPNAIENLLGTDPTQATEGLVLIELSETAVTFAHPCNATPASDLALSYEWSPDLLQFYPADSSDVSGETTVAFTSESDTPSSGRTTVTATISGSERPRSIFVRVQAIQDPVF